MTETETEAEAETRQDMTRQDKTRQDGTSLGRQTDGSVVIVDERTTHMYTHTGMHFCVRTRSVTISACVFRVFFCHAEFDNIVATDKCVCV